VLQPLAEAAVLAPDDMLAVADEDPRATDDDSDGDLHPDLLFLGINGLPHWRCECRLLRRPC